MYFYNFILMSQDLCQEYYLLVKYGETSKVAVFLVHLEPQFTAPLEIKLLIHY